MMASDPLPTFIIGGAPRSGTTFLAEALARHPDVFMARPFIPEPKVFMGPPQPDSVYLTRYAGFFGPANGQRHRGEKTSYYLESADIGKAIHRLMPKVRLLFILREPVARAYSNYRWSTKNGFETLPFEEAIAMEGQRPCPMPPEKSYARPFDYLGRSDYARLARPYLEMFGAQQVRFFLFEDLEHRPRELFRAIQEYLGLDPLPLEDQHVPITNSAKEVGDRLDPSSERRLKEKMRSHVREFALLTALDLSPWGYNA